MTSAISERARELLEWLRYWAWRQCACVGDTVSRLDCVRCGGTGGVVNPAMKSRAEAVESLLAENERLRSALKECGDALGSCQKVIKKYALRLQLGDAGWPKPEMRRATAAVEFARVALNGEPAVDGGSVPGQAEPESDPGLSAGSSPQTAEVIRLRAELAEMIAVVERASRALLEASGALAGTKYFRTAARASAELLRDARAIVSRHRDHAKPPKVTPDA